MLGRRQGLLLGCFPKASWDVCLLGQQLACELLANFYNSLLVGLLRGKGVLQVILYSLVPFLGGTGTDW